MPKTNNSVEGFEATLKAIHPNISRFLEALRHEQTLVEANTQQVITRIPLAKKKKV